MPRHTEKGRAGVLFHRKGQSTRRLGSVHDHGQPMPQADPVQFIQRSDGAKHIGRMAHDHAPGLLRDGPFHLPGHVLRVKQAGGHGGISDPLPFHGLQRPHHAVVFIAGDDGVAPFMEQAFDGQVQTMGGILRKNHPLRPIQAKELRRLFPAGIHHPFGLPGWFVTASPRVGTRFHGLLHRPEHLLWFLQSGGAAVQINHPIPLLFYWAFW